MKLKCYLVLFCISLALALSGCGPGSPGVYQGKAIKSGIFDNIHSLNNTLLTAIKSGKVYDAEAVMSKSLLETNYYKRVLELIGLQGRLGDYTTLDEFYIVNYKPTDVRTLNSRATDGNRYTLNCSAITEEMYIIMMVPKTKADKQMVTAIYCKYNYGWKLNTLSIEPYTITGKTAPQLFLTGLKQYKRGYLIDAYITLEMANRCIKPNQVWVYPEDRVIRTLYLKVADELNKYSYPMVIGQVPSKPKIFEITHSTTDEGVFPAVHYVSTISIKDTAALQKEKNDVVKAIGKMFPGIDQDKKYIFFTAFNQLPTGKKQVAFFDMEAMVGK